MYGPWHKNVPGIYDDPNNYREVLGNPNTDPLYEAEYGDELSAQGSASGSIGLGGAAGMLSGSANAGAGGAAAPAAPTGGSWGIVNRLLAKLKGAQRFSPPRPAMPRMPAVPAPMASVSPAAMALWSRHRRAQQKTRSRESLLEPNKGSTVKVERYTFSVSQDLTTGTASSFSAFNQPDVTFRPQRVTANVPHEGLVIIDGIRVANVNVTVGGVFDAFDFTATGVGQSLDMPTLSPSNKLTVSGGYTGVAFPGIVPPAIFKLVISAKGPASIVA